MATRFNKVLAHLHRVLTPPDDGLSDGQLLARFVAARDQSSFTALVRRHGPMVWRVCLRVLGHVQDAEDTFQATFLVLACKAAAVQKQESVGSFLYGVAYRTALDARTVRLRRRLRERQVEDMPHPEVSPASGPNWRPWLDQELSRLPEKYRAAIILCDLEGQTRKVAARHLKIPEGTLSSRLATARRLLAKRLTRYGLSLSGGALAVALAESSSVAAPTPLVATTVQSAVLIASGQWTVSASVAFLTKGAMKTMLVSKLRWVIGSVMMVTLLGAGGLIYQASGQSAAGDKRGLSEVEALRRENELLKLNLEIVLEKVRAQETELHALRNNAKSMDWNTNTLKVPTAFDPSFPIRIEPAKTGAAKPNAADLQERIKVLESELAMWKERAAWSQRMAQPGRAYVTQAQAEADQARLKAAQTALGEVKELEHQAALRANLADPIRHVEAALKKLSAARDPDSYRAASAELDKAMQQLREHLAKQGLSIQELRLSVPASGSAKPKDEKPSK